jgi:thiol peroxidase
MFKQIFFLSAILCLAVMLGSCATKQPPPTVDSASVIPGTQVTRKGQVLKLAGTGIEVGQKLPETNLVDATTMKNVDLNDLQGSILFLSIVPSIDTKVCEAQTHYLGEQGDKLPSTVKRITISRDTPFAQKRFAKEAKLEDLQYLSDYKEGSFGRSIGLLMDGPRLLARSVIILEKEGIVRYIQVVPEITHLPDMEEAFSKAHSLATQP